MRIPNPIATTTTEAYLAYKAGVLAQADLKEKLYHPYIHIDGWLAYWTGLTDTYPNNGVPSGKNLFNKADYLVGGLLADGSIDASYEDAAVSGFIEVSPNTSYVVSGRSGWEVIGQYDENKRWIGRFTQNSLTTDARCHYIKVGFNLKRLQTLQVEEGSTATGYEPFKGYPECLTDEEAYIAYLAGVTSEYPEALKDPADPRMAGYLKYLISARFGRPNYPVTREELYLSMMKPPIVPSGDPSSSIDLEGTIEAPFISMEMYGDTYQKSYSGKNKIGMPQISETTQDGLTYSISNGILTLNGTATGYVYISGVNYNLVGLEDTNPAFSVIPISGTWNGWIGVRLLNSGNSQIFYQQMRQDGYLFNTNTLSESVAQNAASAQLFFPSGTRFENFQCQVMLTNSSTIETSYEPYVGGIPSPNHDYPQIVQTVSGENTITITGGGETKSFPIGLASRNIFNTLAQKTAGFSATVNGVTVTYNNDGSVSLSGTATTTTDLVIFGTWGNTVPVLPLDAYSSYTLSLFGAMSGLRLTTRGLKNGAVSAFVYDLTGGSQTVSGFSAMTLAQLTIVSGATVNTTVTIQLEQGSTATPYTPFFEPVELCKIGTAQDYIYRQNESWWLHKETAKLAVTGNEPSYVVQNRGNRVWLPYDRNGFSRPINPPSASAKPGIYCDMLPEVTPGNTWDGIRGIAYDYLPDSLGTGIVISLGGTTTESGYRTALAGANIYYILSTPTDTEITNTTLLDQLDALMEGGSYDGETHIRVSANDPNLPALLKVEAAK